MKNLRKIMFFAIAVFVLAVSSSCSKDDDSSDDASAETSTGADFIKFKYKGVSYAFETGYQTSLTLDIIGYKGINDTYKQIALWMPKNPSVGSHPIVYDLSHIETTYQANFTFMPNIDNAYATSGNVNITVNNSKKIEGTFNFSGVKNGETIEITEGSFSVSK